MLLILLQKAEKKIKENTVETQKLDINLKDENVFNKENDKTNLIFEKNINSFYPVNENKNISNFITSFSNGKDENNYENNNINLPKIYNLNEIKNILMKKGFSKEKLDKINEEHIDKKDKENIYLFGIKNTIPRNYNEKMELKEMKMRGRKRLNDNTERKHSKYESDNIIKKCKGILFTNIIEYMNQFINAYKYKNDEKFQLCKLDYKYINNLKKDSEIKLFYMKLKDLASFEISGKYRPIGNNGKCRNMFEIKRILEEEKNNAIIINLLNMTFGDWIDVFTYKNKFDNDINFKGLYDTLEKIDENNNDKYFSRLIFYLFNYKRWFYNKKGRNRKNRFILKLP